MLDLLHSCVYLHIEQMTYNYEWSPEERVKRSFDEHA